MTKAFSEPQRSDRIAGLKQYSLKLTEVSGEALEKKVNNICLNDFKEQESVYEDNSTVKFRGRLEEVSFHKNALVMHRTYLNYVDVLVKVLELSL